MSRRYYRRNSAPKMGELVAFLLTLILFWLFSGMVSGHTSYDRIVSGIWFVIALACIVWIIARRRQHQLAKLKALDMVDIGKMGGVEFEKYVAEILRSRGYKQVTLTEYYDWGIDIIAVKDNVRWGIQVKRYKGPVNVEAVRQVVAALRKYDCERAMVVTNSYYNYQAKELAASNNCLLIDRNTLAEWMIAFQKQASSPVLTEQV